MASGPAVSIAAAQWTSNALAGPAACASRSDCGLLVHAAGGGEFLLKGRVGLGGEAGGLAGAHGLLFVGSLNGSFHLAPDWSVRSVVPFATAGYTAVASARGLVLDTWNALGRLDIHVRGRRGLRVDLRNYGGWLWVAREGSSSGERWMEGSATPIGRSRSNFGFDHQPGDPYLEVALREPDRVLHRARRL